MMTFGASDRTAPETSTNTKATLKQILKMMNSKICKDVVSRDSRLMQDLQEFEKFSSKINFLYFSIYGRTANSKEVAIAAKYIEREDSMTLWGKYIIALLNSPEFLFY